MKRICWNDVVIWWLSFAEPIIKTPKKPKRKKHRPKVVREAKLKTPKKLAVEGEESKTPKRKYVQKKKEVDEYQEYMPVEESADGVCQEGS